MYAHIDADAFFASALQRKHPTLLGKPLLALGMGGGCVIAASYEAKACGIKTGMRLTEAKALCKNAIALPSDFDEALLASKQIESILERQCPIIERYSVDEWFLDVQSLVGGTPKNIGQWAKQIQHTIQISTALSVSIGVGYSKILAKMASEYRKPAGVTVIQSIAYDNAQDTSMVDLTSFLHDRPSDAIPGIGQGRALHTEAQGWKTAWDIAKADPMLVQKLFGKVGEELQKELNGKRVYTLSIERTPPKSISRTRSFRASNDECMVYAHLLHHLTYTILKMRRERLVCRAISVWLRDDKYTSDHRITKLAEPADTEEQILPYMRHCFERMFTKQQYYTQVGMALLQLTPKGGIQYSLFEEPKSLQKAEEIQKALDTLHKRFGREAIKRGSALPVESAKRQRLGITNEEL